VRRINGFETVISPNECDKLSLARKRAGGEPFETVLGESHGLGYTLL
jgi:hypothetical protein